MASRSTPNLAGAAKKAKVENGAATTRDKKKGRVSLASLFSSKNRTVSEPPAVNGQAKTRAGPPQPLHLHSRDPATHKSNPNSPATPTFYRNRCASCEALDAGSVTTPRALSRPPSANGLRSASRRGSQTGLSAEYGSLRGPPNSLYNNVYRHGSHSPSHNSLSPISPVGMSISQSSLSRTSLNPSHTSLNNLSHTSLSLSQTSLVLPDNMARNQLLSKDHYHLRFAATYIINLITPAMKTANFSKSERNMEIKRITEDRLALLQRMERTWGSSWSEAAADLLNGTQMGTTLEVQEAKLRACNITATAKARERKVFVTAVRDGIVLCFLFNRLFPAQPAHIQRVKVPKDDVRIKANIDRFLSACREMGVPESEMFTLADLDEHSPVGLARVARNILVLAQMSGPTSVSHARIVSRIPSRPSMASRSAENIAPQAFKSSSQTSLHKSIQQGYKSSSQTSLHKSITPRSQVTPIATRTIGDRPLRSSSSDLIARLQKENSTTTTPTTSSGSAPASTLPSATSTVSRATPPTPRLSDSSSVTPPLSPVRALTTPSTIRSRESGPVPPLVPRQVRTASGAQQVSFADDASSPRVSGQDWNSSLSSQHSTTYLAPLQEQRILQERERTPSLVSASSHVPSSYSRSSVSGPNFAVPTIVGDNTDDDFELSPRSDELSSRSEMSPETRRMSEQTLQEARRKIIGTLMSSTEDLSLQTNRGSTDEDARGYALSQSLAVLEGSRPPLNKARSESPRLRPISRGARHSVEMQLHDRVEEEGQATRPASELPPRPRIRRPSVNGKIYVPKRSHSPASPNLSMNGFPSAALILDPSGDFDSGRQLTKEERRRSEDFASRGAAAVNAARIMNMRNHSMVNLPSRRTSTLSQGSRDSTHQVMQILEFTDAGIEPVRYQLGNCIGRGQFGSVYRSLNLTTGQMVAIKRIRLSGMREKEVCDVMREVELLKRLTHPGIVKYDGMKRDEHYLNIILEFVENGSLGQTLKAFGKFNERLVASYVAKILEGLHYLHSEGVVHCDLKAANILSTKNGNVKLSDFGVSLNMKAVEQFAHRASMGKASKANEIAGTPNWMAPEIIKLAGASPASDIWSLGCTIIELITGKPPYSDVPNSMTVLFRVVEDPMPPIPETSPELQHFLKQCFIKEPSERPSAAMLWSHDWVRAGRGEAPLRPQESVPFLRRLSQEPAHHRLEAQRAFNNSSSLPHRSASASLVDLSSPQSDIPPVPPLPPQLNPQMSMVSLHSQIHQAKDDGGLESSAARAHSLVKMIFGKGTPSEALLTPAITCHVCLMSVKRSAYLCQNCGLITHSKCAATAHPRCDVREQLALLAGHQDSVNGFPVNGLPRVHPNSPYQEQSQSAMAQLGSRIFGRSRSKRDLSTASLSPAPDNPRRYSSGGSAGGTPGPSAAASLSAGDTVGSLRSRHSEASEDSSAHRDRSTSLIRIDEDGPGTGTGTGPAEPGEYTRPALRIEDRRVKPGMPPAVEGPRRRASATLRRRSGDLKGDCVVQ